MSVLRSHAVVITCLDYFSNRWLFLIDIHWTIILLFFLFALHYYDVMVLFRMCIFIFCDSDITVESEVVDL